MWPALIHFLGIDQGQPYGQWNNYNFWSGVGSDLGELTLVGGLVALYRKNKCHEARCHRLAKHHVAGTPYTVCRRHHPAVPNRASKGDIAAAHAQSERIAASATRTKPPAEPVATRRKRL